MYYDFDEIDWRKVGARIVSEREKLNSFGHPRGSNDAPMTQSELAHAADISRSQIGYLEAGYRRVKGEVQPVNPTLETLFKIANYLERDLMWFLGLGLNPEGDASVNAEVARGRALSLQGLSLEQRLLIAGIRDLMLTLDGKSLESVEDLAESLKG